MEAIQNDAHFELLILDVRQKEDEKDYTHCAVIVLAVTCSELCYFW